MKTLVKLAVLAGAAAGVAWLMKDRLVPAPEGPVAEPPKFRVAPDPPDATVDVKADDLSAVKGIGPVYSRRLAESGIVTFAGLASSDAATIAGAAEVTEAQAEDWIQQAAGLAAGD